MKRVLAALSLALAGCSTTWTRADTDEATFNRDRYECEQQAAASFPAAVTQVQTSAGYTAPQRPIQTQCTTVGNQTSCNSKATGVDASVYNTPPQYATVDANASRRGNAAASCLYARGYTKK